MIRPMKLWAGVALLASALLSACGGGGGSAGDTPLDPGSGSGSGSGGTTTYAISVSVQSNGTDVTTVTSTQSARARAVVTTSGGSPVSGVVVTFSESEASILTFAPTSATALTDSDGVAELDVSATSTSSTGATTINAAATVSGTAVAASTSIQVKAGTVDNPTPTPASINFKSVVPADQAIVIKGAGGNGRSESATLTFEVVDGSGQPIEGATVLFSVNPAGTVSLNITSAVSNSVGLVTTTVQSGTSPTSVVITATAQADTSVTGQSDTLVVSNGVAVEGGFEVVAEKYNLDGGLTGDTTKVSAYVRDSFGNPVPDGVAVSFTTDFGSVASSTLGGCVTVDGTCTVEFRVQEPRGDGLATVLGTVRVSDSQLLSDNIAINMSGGSGLIALTTGGTVATSLSMSSCKQKFSFLLADAVSGRSPPAGTKVSEYSSSSNITTTVPAGATVPDMPSPTFGPAPFTIEVDASSESLAPRCLAGGSSRGQGTIELQFTTPSGRFNTQRFDLSYPR